MPAHAHSKMRIVNVHASETSSGWKFTMEEFDEKSGRGIPRERLHFSKTDDGIYRSGHHKVEFRLKRPPNSQLRFHDDWREVFWIGPPVAADPSKPDELCCKPYANVGNEVRMDRIDPLHLSGKNHNRTHRELAFNLGFQEGDDPTRIAFDPGWTNSNGGFEDLDGGGFALSLALATALTGAAALTWWALTKSGGDQRNKRRKRR